MWKQPDCSWEEQRIYSLQVTTFRRNARGGISRRDRYKLTLPFYLVAYYLLVLVLIEILLKALEDARAPIMMQNYHNSQSLNRIYPHNKCDHVLMVILDSTIYRRKLDEVEGLIERLYIQVTPGNDWP